MNWFWFWLIIVAAAVVSSLVTIGALDLIRWAT